MFSYIDAKFTKPVALKPGTTLNQLNEFFFILNETGFAAISHSATIVNGKVRLNINNDIEKPKVDEQIKIIYTPTTGKGLVDASTPYALKDLSHSKKRVTIIKKVS